MPLFEKLNNALKAAMKSGDKARLEVLRFVMAGIQGAQKEAAAKKPGAVLTDDEVIALLQKEAKRRKEAVALFRQGGRNDLVEKEEADLAVIYEYIPKELSAEEIDAIIDELKGQGANDFNSLMREVMKRAKGRADGKTVGDAIKKKLE